MSSYYKQRILSSIQQSVAKQTEREREEREQEDREREREQDESEQENDVVPFGTLASQFNAINPKQYAPTMAAALGGYLARDYDIPQNTITGNALMVAVGGGGRGYEPPSPATASVGTAPLSPPPPPPLQPQEQPPHLPQLPQPPQPPQLNMRPHPPTSLAVLNQTRQHRQSFSLTNDSSSTRTPIQEPFGGQPQPPNLKRVPSSGAPQLMYVPSVNPNSPINPASPNDIGAGAGAGAVAGAGAGAGIHTQQLLLQQHQLLPRNIPGMINRPKPPTPQNVASSMSIEWNEALEQLLITWAEKANGHAWLHSRCINHYKQKSKWITIPAAIFGYLAGTTTLLGGDSLNQEAWFRGLVGISAIVAGILSNLQQTFTYKELSEQHRIASLRFFAFFRDVSAELSLEYKHRANVLDYITLKRMELDKLYEQSPTIPQVIIDEFNKKFRLARYHKPDVALNLQTIVPYSKMIRQINNGIAVRNGYENDLKNGAEMGAGMGGAGMGAGMGGEKKHLLTRLGFGRNGGRGGAGSGIDDFGSDKASLTLSDRIEKEKHRELVKEAFKRWKWYYLRRHYKAVENAEKEHGPLVEVANSDGGSYRGVPRKHRLARGMEPLQSKKSATKSPMNIFWGGANRAQKEQQTETIPLKRLISPKKAHAHTEKNRLRQRGTVISALSQHYLDTENRRKRSGEREATEKEDAGDGNSVTHRRAKSLTNLPRIDRIANSAANSAANSTDSQRPDTENNHHDKEEDKEEEEEDDDDEDEDGHDDDTAETREDNNSVKSRIPGGSRSETSQRRLTERQHKQPHKQPHKRPHHRHHNYTLTTSNSPASSPTSSATNTFSPTNAPNIPIMVAPDPEIIRQIYTTKNTIIAPRIEVSSENQTSTRTIVPSPPEN